MGIRKIVALWIAVVSGIGSFAQDGVAPAPAPAPTMAVAPAPEALTVEPEPAPESAITVPIPSPLPSPAPAPTMAVAPAPEAALTVEPEPAPESAITVPIPSPLPSPPPPSSPPPPPPPPPVFVPVPFYVEVPARQCQELSAEAESIASAEGACDSEAYAYAYATAVIACNADGSQSLSVEANSEALAALEARCDPPSDTPCTDAFIDLARTAVFGCDSPAFQEKDTTAKNACGYVVYSLLQSHLGICVHSIPVAPPPTGGASVGCTDSSPGTAYNCPTQASWGSCEEDGVFMGPGTCDFSCGRCQSIDSAGGTSCAELIVQATAAAETSGCDSEAYKNAQTSAEVVCALDADPSAANALAGLASSCEYSLGSSIQQDDCYSAFTDLLASSRVNGCASAEYRLANELAKSTCTVEGYADLKALTAVCDISVAGDNTTGIDGGYAPGALVAAMVAAVVALV